MFTKLRRLYFNIELIEAKKITITDKELLNRLLNVLRLRPTDKIRVFNSRDGEYLANVLDIKKNQLTLEIERHLRGNALSCHTGLIVPLFKPDRLRWLVEKAVELRAGEIIFYTSKNAQKYSYQEDKIQKYMISACEQSERLSIPNITFASNIEEVLISSKKNILLCNEKEETKFILDVFPAANNEVSIMIGPEGGFTEDELNIFKNINTVSSVHLGRTIMRVETAAIYALSAIDAYLERNDRL